MDIMRKMNILKVKHALQNYQKTFVYIKHLSTYKKELHHPMQQTPVVGEIESGWYDWWEKNKFFKHKDSEDKFVMLLPPPNVTGKLHMGHALTCALQDALVRWNHMKGRQVHWIPGYDHAGIGTQVVVERHLVRTQGLSRHDLSRERFTAEVWKWKDESQASIDKQMKRLGVALDWDRAYFTLDPGVSEAVLEAFAQLFRAGLIYRGAYMVNWCCTLESSISDLEVETLEVETPQHLTVPGHERPILFGLLYNIRYQLLDSDATVTVSTTRPETVLGDTGLAIHPHDPCNFHLIGKRARHPFTGRPLPIVADKTVKRDLGTGVVKVTPAHSIADHEIAERHGLETIEIFDDRGWILANDVIPVSQPRFDARDVILERLASLGLLVGSKPHPLQLPRCARTGDVIEPRLKTQWFLRTRQMAEDALEAVDTGRLRIHPPAFAKRWCDFLAHHRDWCLSRQLWWGHRIPAFWASTLPDSVYGSPSEIEDGSSTFVVAAHEEAAARQGANLLGVDRARIVRVEQDPDVLDTWFSSALLPLVVDGWPRKGVPVSGGLLPLSLMETGHDILFFWVARMAMLGQQLTGSLPFQDVLLHGLVRDEKGKMSKSKGNALDPLDIIEGRPRSQEAAFGHDKEGSKANRALGADALRFYLCSRVLKETTIVVTEADIETIYTFRNKMWQSLRFLVTNAGEVPGGAQVLHPYRESSWSDVLDRWLASQLAQMVRTVHDGFSTYNVHMAAKGVHTFWHLRLCDAYLEMCKPRLWGIIGDPDGRRDCLQAIWSAIHTSVVALAPFMPFLSEEMYARLPSTASKEDSVMQCRFPCPEEWDEYSNPDLDREVEICLAAIHVVRGMRKIYNIVSKTAQGKATIYIADECVRRTCDRMLGGLQRYSFMASLTIAATCEDMSEGLARQSVRPGVIVEMDLKGVVDPARERERLGKQVSKLLKKRDAIERRPQPVSLDPAHLLKVKELDKEIDIVRSLLRTVENMK